MKSSPGTLRFANHSKWRPSDVGLRWSRGGMSVTITFRDQPKHERRGDEHCYSSFSRREAESLPHFIEFKTPGLFNQVTNLFKRGVVKTVNRLHRCLVRRLLKQERLIRIGALRWGRGWLRDRQGKVLSQCRWLSRREGRRPPSRRGK